MTELLPHDPPAGHRDGIICADRLDHAELSKMGVFFCIGHRRPQVPSWRRVARAVNWPVSLIREKASSSDASFESSDQEHCVGGRAPGEASQVSIRSAAST
jgi:hypothetical protein